MAFFSMLQKQILCLFSWPANGRLPFSEQKRTQVFSCTFLAAYNHTHSLTLACTLSQLPCILFFLQVNFFVNLNLRMQFNKHLLAWKLNWIVGKMPIYISINIIEKSAMISANWWPQLGKNNRQCKRPVQV